MGLIEIIVIMTAVVAASIGVIYIITRIASFYKQRFGFSIFSGVILMILSFALLYFSAMKQTSSSVFLQVVSAGLAVFTLVRDIQLAKLAYGVFAFFIHIVLAILSFVIVAFAFTALIIKKLTNSHNRLYSRIMSPSLLDCFSVGALLRFFQF